MHLSDFDYCLPPELIAVDPLPQRGQSRLMNLTDSEISEMNFSQIHTLLQPNDLLVLNNSKVIPARLLGHKSSGGQVEIFLERIIDTSDAWVQLKSAHNLKINDPIFLPNGHKACLISRPESPQSGFYKLSFDEDPLVVFETYGQVPLPPYIKRAPQKSDEHRYQTCFAKHSGSVAAPTAGLHFDEVTLQKIRDKGVKIGEITLHVGAGTFKPIKIDDFSSHQMHSEFFDISESLIQAIHQAKERGGRIIAVGTTSLRALESLAIQYPDQLQPHRGETRLFVYPGFKFQLVDTLITNFHLPKSTLLLLVCAFGGTKTVLDAYQKAIEQQFRFFSYGDAMILSRATDMT
jgi:S-adenosylmethionine:tRNA ribosyltransferase-isomerase